MAWLLVAIAGVLEVCWAVGLKFTGGFTRPVPSVAVASAIALSMLLLAQAARTLPIGTAYAVWVGIGVFGTAVAGVVLFREPLTPARILFLLLLLTSLVGLKLTT
jgi:quaternary ammonium compound-resistance protein SugE